MSPPAFLEDDILVRRLKTASLICQQLNKDNVLVHFHDTIFIGLVLELSLDLDSFALTAIILLQRVSCFCQIIIALQLPGGLRTAN